MSGLIGQTINQSYNIQRELARGGMATIYLARQLSMDRDVAIKVLPREFLHEVTFIDRFKQEVAITARLEHRSIIPVYDHGEWDGMPYIVMRYMEGLSVDTMIQQQGVLSVPQVQQIVRQVASALDYAHTQGVLHRDLKPSNILLDRNGDAYITDFGIARILHSNENLTSTGVVGTPSYMSPEQAQGLTLDGRSDVYALGVVIFEMLTGQRPFESETPYSVAVMHVTQPAPDPRTRQPDIPRGIAQVVLKSLEKSPSHRYPTAVALADALESRHSADGAADVTYTNTPPPISIVNEPTPRHTTAPVPPHAVSSQPISQPVRSVRRSRGWLWLILVGLISVALGGSVLGIYAFVTRGNDEPISINNTLPIFSSTGEARLTATAQIPRLTFHGMTGELFYIASDQDIYQMQLESGSETRLTQTDGAESMPALSPDGEQLVYMYQPQGRETIEQSEVYLYTFATSETQQLTSNLSIETSPIWSPDGTEIYYTQLTEDNNLYRIVRYQLDNQREEPVYETSGVITGLSIAPDGEHIIFALQENNDSDLLILELSTSSVRRLTDTDDLSERNPLWHPRDNVIFFLQENRTVLTMDSEGNNETILYTATQDIDTITLSSDISTLLFVANKTIYTFDGTTTELLVEQAASPILIR